MNQLTREELDRERSAALARRAVAFDQALERVKVRDRLRQEMLDSAPRPIWVSRARKGQ